MLIDHIAWAFVPMPSAMGLGLHLIGRVTAPCMCFFIAEGYAHTRSVSRYALRLGLFALLSWPCFSYFETGQFFTPHFGMIFSLFFALLAVMACDRLRNPIASGLAVAVCCLPTLFGDWKIFAVLFAVAAWHSGQNFRKLALSFSVLNVAHLFLSAEMQPVYLVMNCGVWLALIPLSFYSGARGGAMHPVLDKWFFYFFYPVHLLLLGWLRYGMAVN